MIWLRRLLVMETVVVTASGVPLIWMYQPSIVSDGTGDWLRVAHALGSTAMLYTAFVALAAVVVTHSTRHRWPWVLAFFILVGALSYTGYLLPWEQLAFWVVTVGTDIKGVLEPFSDDVRFVLVGGSEVGADTYTRWVLVHVAALPLLGLGGLWWFRRRVGSRPHAPDAGAPHVRRDDAVARHGDPQPDA